jgi:hypothetical protein
MEGEEESGGLKKEDLLGRAGPFPILRPVFNQMRETI